MVFLHSLPSLSLSPIHTRSARVSYLVTSYITLSLYPLNPTLIHQKKRELGNIALKEKKKEMSEKEGNNGEVQRMRGRRRRDKGRELRMRERGKDKESFFSSFFETLREFSFCTCILREAYIISPGAMNIYLRHSGRVSSTWVPVPWVQTKYYNDITHSNCDIDETYSYSFGDCPDCHVLRNHVCL